MARSTFANCICSNPFLLNFGLRKVLNCLESICAVFHTIFFIATIAIFTLMSQRSTPGFVFNTLTTGSGWGNPGVAWSIGLLTTAFLISSSDDILHMSTRAFLLVNDSLMCFYSSNINALEGRSKLTNNADPSNAANPNSPINFCWHTVFASVVHQSWLLGRFQCPCRSDYSRALRVLPHSNYAPHTAPARG